MTSSIRVVCSERVRVPEVSTVRALKLLAPTPDTQSELRVSSASCSIASDGVIQLCLWRWASWDTLTA